MNERNNKIFKIGFYLFWAAILYFGMNLEDGRDFPSDHYCWLMSDTSGLGGLKGILLIDGVYKKGFFVAFGIQVVLNILKWVIFDRNQKEGESNE